MFPVVHPGVGYLLYSVGHHLTGRDAPTDSATLALVLGALLPDLVDQPLHALLELPSTRTLAHSALIAVPICLLALIAVRRSDLSNDVGLGFVVGYLSHLAADALWPLVLGKYHELGFLLWPITHSPPYEGQKLLFTIGETPFMTYWVELALFATALVLWWRDGRPGIPTRIYQLG